MLIGVAQVKAIKLSGSIKIIIIFKTIFTFGLIKVHLKMRTPKMKRLPAKAGSTRLISQIPVAAA